MPGGKAADDVPEFADVAVPRVAERLRVLEELVGTQVLPVPPVTDEAFRPSTMASLPPADDAAGGKTPVVRSGFVAKYRPDHDRRGDRLEATDPCWEYPWD